MQKITLLILALISHNLSAESCNNWTSKYSNLTSPEGSERINTLHYTNKNGTEKDIIRGWAKYIDLNADKKNDLIFMSYQGMGSSLEPYFYILINCDQYYVPVGSGNYVKMEPLNKVKKNHKIIVAYLYERNKNSEILFKKKGALIRALRLEFDSAQEKYIEKESKESGELFYNMESGEITR